MNRSKRISRLYADRYGRPGGTPARPLRRSRQRQGVQEIVQSQQPQLVSNPRKNGKSTRTTVKRANFFRRLFRRKGH